MKNPIKNAVQCGTAFGPSGYGQIIWDFQTGPLNVRHYPLGLSTSCPCCPERDRFAAMLNSTALVAHYVTVRLAYRYTMPNPHLYNHRLTSCATRVSSLIIRGHFVSIRGRPLMILGGGGTREKNQRPFSGGKMLEGYPPGKKSLAKEKNVKKAFLISDFFSGPSRVLMVDPLDAVIIYLHWPHHDNILFSGFGLLFLFLFCLNY